MTATELLNLWRLRDNRYAMRREALTTAEYESSIAWRRSELQDVPIAERSRCAVALSMWSPKR